MAKLLFILMPNFKDEEFTVTYKIIKDAGHTIDVAGLQEGPAVGSQGHKHTPNLLVQKLKTEDLNTYDALVIPGGPGAKKHLWPNEDVKKIILYFHEQKKLVAAICYAVVALVQTGILRNKHATVYPTDEAKAILEEYGVRFSKDGCVSLRPEKIITGQGPSFAEDFGKAIVSQLSEK